METFSKSATFAGVDLGRVASAKHTAFYELVTYVLGLHQVGSLVRVSPLVTHSMSELQSATRLLQVGKHMVGIFIIARGSDIVLVSVPSLLLIQRLINCR